MKCNKPAVLLIVENSDEDFEALNRIIDQVGQREICYCQISISKVGNPFFDLRYQILRSHIHAC